MRYALSSLQGIYADHKALSLGVSPELDWGRIPGACQEPTGGALQGFGERNQLDIRDDPTSRLDAEDLLPICVPAPIGNVSEPSTEPLLGHLQGTSSLTNPISYLVHLSVGSTKAQISFRHRSALLWWRVIKLS
jgi:hypothetical protein